MLLVTNNVPAIRGGPSLGLTQWRPYHFSANASPINPVAPFPAVPVPGVCPANPLYDVYIARCDLTAMSPTVPAINCYKVLTAGQTCDFTENTKPIFNACDNIICFIQNPTNPTNYPNPIDVSVEIVALWSLDDIPDPLTNYVPVITKMRWSASSNFLSTQTIMNGTPVPLDWSDTSVPIQTGTINGPVRILLANTNETAL
jgi:hypothetical protein